MLFPAGTASVEIVAVMAAAIALCVLYLLPTFFGLAYRSRNIGAVFLVNAVFGWTVLGWFTALLLAAEDRPASALS